MDEAMTRDMATIRGYEGDPESGQKEWRADLEAIAVAMERLKLTDPIGSEFLHRGKRHCLNFRRWGFGVGREHEFQFHVSRVIGPSWFPIRFREVLWYQCGYSLKRSSTAAVPAIAARVAGMIRERQAQS